jgi:hypothetical protein
LRSFAFGTASAAWVLIFFFLRRTVEQELELSQEACDGVENNTAANKAAESPATIFVFMFILSLATHTHKK